MQPIILMKASGEQEVFSEKKFRRSLKRSGASEETIAIVLQQLLPELYNGITTKKLYQMVRKLLKKTKATSVVGRYHLKNAIFELGPSGFPFESFIGKLLAKQGYSIEIGKRLPGKCASSHETDVLATKDNDRILIECKFHNQPGINATIRTSLYLKARFDDITEKYIENHEKPPCSASWIVTNTRFTSMAIEYGECRGIVMRSWSYPKNDGLKDMIDTYGLHPITCLSSISKKNMQLY